MTILPRTSPNPKPIIIFMPGTSNAEAGPALATATAALTSSAIPRAPVPAPDAAPPSEDQVAGPEAASKGRDNFPLPKLRLELRDLSHSGTKKFLSSVNASEVMEKAVANVLRILYKSPSEAHTHPPPTRSVTVVLRDMDGVAYVFSRARG
jgi:hypothetical protein